ncbi:hypothetical protein PLESTF_000110800 [Pleodorina starrii]|nr:hypothetical protein PLESTF_000110800 [Pleodorina starrii]
MSLRCQGAPSACPQGHAAGRGRGVTLRATSSAVLTKRTTEAGSPRRPASASQSRAFDFSEPALPVSSGLDFIDLVGMDDSIVWNRLQDAVTYRVLVGQPSLIRQPSRPTHAKTFNVKQLKLYRDNVTRNLAPTVARGFANAARAAGHVIAITQPAQQSQRPSPAEPPPPPPSPQRPQQLAAATAVNPAPTSVIAAAAGDSSVGHALGSESPRRQTQHSSAQIPVVAAVAASHSAAGCRPARRVSLAAAGHNGEQQRIAVRCAAQARQLQLAPEEGPGATGAATGSGAATASVAQQQQQQPSQFTAAAPPSLSPVAVSSVAAAPVPSGSLPFEAAGTGVGPAASALVSGRRRGSRGAGRGPLLSAAGRQAGTAGAGASTGPAWI